MSRLFRRRPLNWLVIGFLVASCMPVCNVFSQDGTAEDATAEATTEAVADATGSAAGSSMEWLMYVIPVLGLIGLIFTFWKSSWVSAQEVGTDKMAGIAKNITDGAMSFLKAEYLSLIHI